MKDLYDFISASPWIAFFIACIIAGVIKFTFSMCINRPLRHMNIRKHGWPPEHCDADGDLVKTSDE